MMVATPIEGQWDRQKDRILSLTSLKDDFLIQITFLETLSPAFKAKCKPFYYEYSNFKLGWDYLIAAIYETKKLIAYMDYQ